MKKMLFVSSSDPKTLNSMYEAFKELNDVCVDISYRTNTHSTYYDDKRSFMDVVFFKLKIPLDKEKHNDRIISLCKEYSYDYVFIVKGNHIKPSTLKKIKQTNKQVKIISWTQDDMYAWHNRTFYYSRGLKYYDLVVTQKSYNCKSDELPSLGAKKILFQNKSYLPKIHKPHNDSLKKEFKHDVLFIGSAELERFRSMNFLAKNGITVNIYGSGWDKNYFKKNAHKNLIFNFKNLINEEYANAISCSKISLCFLRKKNRDLQTSRTIEIPACGGFMLAEKTNEQMQLFKEGIEAEYFDSNNELMEKIKFYLQNDNKRLEIANKGLLRCKLSDYSYQNRAKEIIKYLKII
jgi:spore maturation protein CgeB